MTKGIIRNKRGISPVIATVILVAVAITVSIAVAYWMGGIASLYTRFEKLEISNIYAQAQVQGSWNWTVTMKVKNTGSADATIDDLVLNGIPFASLVSGNAQVRYSTDGGTTWTTKSVGQSLSVVIGSGSSADIKVDFDPDAFSSNQPSSGTTIEVKLHSVSGQNYPKMVQLP